MTVEIRRYKKSQLSHFHAEAGSFILETPSLFLFFLEVRFINHLSFFYRLKISIRCDIRTIVETISQPNVLV